VTRKLPPAPAPCVVVAASKKKKKKIPKCLVPPSGGPPDGGRKSREEKVFGGGGETGFSVSGAVVEPGSGIAAAEWETGGAGDSGSATFSEKTVNGETTHVVAGGS
jgi:hypothetical protein